ncbi:hypothetical protein C1645_878369 [Glomus cerebriforme]|uniref:Uncharacterized protein n=1 Tax=Glomus cerebriforme TaxID=658196 RepID=A0A397SLB2_9GLOM|nr:hypothetical protein C1645_878369 [Glomus cerebriforme]
MQVILSKEDIDEHLFHCAEIDKKIKEMLEGGLNWHLIWIDLVYIEAYIYYRVTGGFFILTSKKLTIIKCTINSDNSKIIDLITGKLTDNCLKDALGIYFAYHEMRY